MNVFSVTRCDESFVQLNLSFDQMNMESDVPVRVANEHTNNGEEHNANGDIGNNSNNVDNPLNPTTPIIVENENTGMYMNIIKHHLLFIEVPCSFWQIVKNSFPKSKKLIYGKINLISHCVYNY